MSYNKVCRATSDLAAKAIWKMPGRFGIAYMLGPSYSLRCVVFHHVSAAESPFTSGINVRTTPERLEAALKFLTTHYKPVTLENVLENQNGRGLPPRAVLVTFDDAYASVVEVAAPLCQKYGVPAVYFVNAGFLNNQRLAPDNLVCYIANINGMATINAAAQTVKGMNFSPMHSLSDVFLGFFPSITLDQREAFLEALGRLAGISELPLAEEANLYLTTEQLRSLASFEFEIGNHTYSHVHCRRLSRAAFEQEIDRNRAELEALSGSKVRSFSQPYGSSKDLTQELASHLRESGYEAVFLSESVSNMRGADRFHLDRVNPRVQSDDSLFLDLEVRPRLRAVRNRLFHASSRDAKVEELE